jgi:hypothetical protein
MDFIYFYEFIELFHNNKSFHRLPHKQSYPRPILNHLVPLAKSFKTKPSSKSKVDCDSSKSSERDKDKSAVKENASKKLQMIARFAAQRQVPSPQPVVNTFARSNGNLHRSPSTIKAQNARVLDPHQL